MDRIRIAQAKYIKELFPKLFEDERLKTFYKWPHKRPSPSELAKAGFFFIGNDTVQCAYCGHNLKDWLPLDNPLEEHKRLLPKCPVFGENPLQ